MKTRNKLRLLTTMVLGTCMMPAFADLPKLADTFEQYALEKEVTNIYRAYFPSKDIARKTTITFHSQLHETNWEDGYLILELSSEEIEKIKTFGYKIQPATEFIQRRNSRLDKLQQQFQHALNSDATTQAIPNYPCYETVEETFSSADSIVANHSNLAKFVDVGNSWRKTQNLGGYDIKVLQLTNQSTSGEKPILFVNSAIHAREYTTAPLSLAFANWLVDGYGSNADATWLLDHHEIHLMLHTNPDGRKKAESGLSWRKNTNQNYCGSTSNSRGADLNRNFTFAWNITNGQGSSGNQCSDTYRGPSAGSEPEIQAMQSYVRSIFPDRRGPGQNDAAPSDTSGIHIDIHSYSELVLWPWGHTNQQAPNGTQLQTLGRKFAYFNGYTPQQSIGLYPTDGTSDDVSYGELGVAAYTFELGTSFFQSCSTYQNTILPDNLEALVYAAKVARLPYITPGGPDITSVKINNTADIVYLPQGESATLTASTTDTRFNSSNGTESTQNITAAEYYVDTPPWQSGATALPLSAQDGSFNNKTESVTGSINTDNLAYGRHIIYVRAKDANNTWGAVSAIFVEITDTVEPTENELLNGQTRSNLSGARDDEDYYFMEVPAGATSLKFVMSGGSGDADMYVKYGSKPTTSDWECRPYKGGNDETCDITNIQAGAYHVLVRGYSAYSNASLTGTFTTSTPTDGFENTNNVDIPDNNPTGAVSEIEVTRSGSSGTVMVELEVIHTYIGDLVIDLIAPDNSVYNLHDRTGGSADNINQTYNVNVGFTNSNGTWKLKVTDQANRDVGYIDRVKLFFDNKSK
ncbi:M14 family zinc carboxypeptidase [Aliikangiella maris]|uniref:M14 family zinc carboxypeptidase n=2 Tax=Aliikangiella maris TaxID=3162458 RepID=A0ABV3MJN6_9GAMM